MMEGLAKIGPVWYEIFEVKGLKDGEQGLEGWAKHSLSQILIEGKLGIQRKKAILWHEIIHLVLVQLGRDKLSADDDLVEALAHKMMQVVEDNPWLTEGVCEFTEKSYMDWKDGD